MEETKDRQIPNLYTVAIIGGGPAGITTALTLTARGISNCVVEASDRPNRKIGEALPPNAKPLLKQLGISALVEEERHIEYYGNKSCWGDDDLQQKEFISDIHGHGYLLDRLYFEQQLWDCYLARSGDLLNGYRLNKISRIDKGFTLNIGNKAQSINLQSKYVVDATGRKASVCRQLGIDKINLDSQFALSLTAKMDIPLPRQILVEATQNGWWYVAPNGEYEMTMMFFTLRQLIPQKHEIELFLKKELESCIHLSKIISSSSISNAAVKIMSAGTSRLEVPYGKNWVAVGDAAFSFDPISSYGITSALASGYYAAQAIASQLSGKSEAMDAYRYIVENAFQAYQEKLAIHYNIELRWKDSQYWKNRLSKVRY